MSHVLDLRQIEEKPQIHKVSSSRMKKAFRIVFEWFIYMIVFVVIVWGTPLTLKAILKTDYPIASITSSSMWPALKKGDIVFIKGVFSAEDVVEGDIVVFENEKGFTIHRVVKIGDGELTTKGDANNVADKPVTYDKIVGKAVHLKENPIKIPVLGKLSQMFK